MLSKQCGRINSRALSMSTPRKQLWNHKRTTCAAKDTKWSTEPLRATDKVWAFTAIHADKESHLQMENTIAPPATKTITNTVSKWTQNSKRNSTKNNKKKKILQLKLSQKHKKTKLEYNIIV
jgi:hypothetical protein